MSEEQNTGVRSLLSKPLFYEGFQSLVIGRRTKHWLLGEHIRPRPGMRVVDVGCGPGLHRGILPKDLDYYGFDPNGKYVAAARKNAGCRDRYFAGEIAAFLEEYGDELRGEVDLVTCFGVLHHVTDEEMNRILEATRWMLGENGRFVGIEPTFLTRQDFISRSIMNLDRGGNILYDFEWRRRMEMHFPRVESKVVNGLLRIPYLHCLLTGSI